MQANTYELKQILTPERRYVIPTFQRDYEWTQEGQWELLFEDLEAVVDRLEHARGQADVLGTSKTKAEKSVAPHFLGAIVCDQLPSPAGGLDLRAVIDGQQRLTTLQLLVRGVLDVLLETDSSRVKQVRRLLENPSDVIEEDFEKHKLWPRRKDREVWPIAMSDQTPAKGSHLYLMARAFFADKARSAIVGTDGSDRTDTVVDALVDLFKLVVIDLEENDDAQVIFEVLNGRQTPLSASDLVKNLLFLRGELADEKALDTIYDKYWAPFDDQWWKETIGRGHAARGRRDALLSSWLTAVSGEEANIGHLYGEVKTYLNQSERKTHDVLAELHSYGQAYRAVYGATDAGSAALKQMYARLNRLGVTTAVPLLWLRTLSSDQLSTAEHVAAVSAIESWVFRRVLVGANTRGYGKAFVDVLNTGRRSEGLVGTSIAEAITNALLSGPQGLHWPSDSEVEAAFVGSKFYGSFTQERIRMILGAIDAQLQRENPKTESATFDYDTLHIEHVMPQGWREHWPLDNLDEAERVLASQARDHIVHRLGNLTLVTPSFNWSVSNLGWMTKKCEFAEQSKLQLNSSIASVDSWNESTIEERARRLAAVAVRVWPRPEYVPE